jgi:hypothetical protein
MWEVSKQKEETANMVTAPPNLLYLLNYFLGIICASAPRTLTAYSIINLNVDLFYKLRILHSRSLASQLQSRAGLRAASYSSVDAYMQMENSHIALVGMYLIARCL